jgi:hypothetical protein
MPNHYSLKLIFLFSDFLQVQIILTRLMKIQKIAVSVVVHPNGVVNTPGYTILVNVSLVHQYLHHGLTSFRYVNNTESEPQCSMLFIGTKP